MASPQFSQVNLGFLGVLRLYECDALPHEHHFSLSSVMFCQVQGLDERIGPKATAYALHLPGGTTHCRTNIYISFIAHLEQ